MLFPGHLRRSNENHRGIRGQRLLWFRRQPDDGGAEEPPHIRKSGCVFRAVPRGIRFGVD